MFVAHETPAFVQASARQAPKGTKIGQHVFFASFVFSWAFGSEYLIRVIRSTCPP
jgi:hypothetical protein